MGDEVFRVQLGRHNKETVAVRQRLVELYEAWGKTERAAQFATSLLEPEPRESDSASRVPLSPAR